MNTPRQLAGKVAFVTGAGSGIGAAVARAAAADGATIALFDLDGEAAENVATEIRIAGGGAAVFIGDVRDATEAARGVTEAVATFGGLDLLVNSAGVVRYGETPDFTEEDWDFIVDTNLKGSFLTTKYVVPEMRKRGAGAIVHTASVQAFASQPRVTAYSASKGGVVAMTRTMALDHAKDGIRVNCVAPGSVRTPMLRQGAEIFAPDDPEGAIESWGQLHPIGRVIEPEEVAKLIVFLVSDEAAAITGACYTIDGGLLARLAV